MVFKIFLKKVKCRIWRPFDLRIGHFLILFSCLNCLLFLSTLDAAYRKCFSKPILFMAVHRADISKRNTMLGERIRLYCKAYHTERNTLPELQQAG